MHRAFPTHVGVNRKALYTQAVGRAFPTHVGVNRPAAIPGGRPDRLPHACGGEPQVRLCLQAFEIAFPTHVGVNRTSHGLLLVILPPSPRMWG